jgi:hypothetical protein
MAREAESKKGMDASQVTGASSSYARKCALSGLFLIDDTKDSDAQNHQPEQKKQTKPAKPAVDYTILPKSFQVFDKDFGTYTIISKGTPLVNISREDLWQIMEKATTEKWKESIRNAMDAREKMPFADKLEGMPIEKLEAKFSRAKTEAQKEILKQKIKELSAKMGGGER